MFKALVQHGDQAAILELPSNNLSLRYDLSLVGVYRLEDIPIDDDEDRDIQVKLFADSDIGNRLAMLFNSSHSLEYANRCAHAWENAHPAIWSEMEQHIACGGYISPQAVSADLQALTERMTALTVHYYCPLKIQMLGEDYRDVFEVDRRYALANEDAIRELVMREQSKDLNNMAFYFHGSESAKAKLISALWDVEEVEGKLYGVIRTALFSAFTPEEEREWIEELVGQAADGFGEGLEQREIPTEDGDIYVAFWDSDDEYFMENETDFRQRLAVAHDLGQPQMGGM